MADLTQEQFDTLPDFLKEDYTEVDGAYKHAGMMKVKQTANDLDARLKARDGEYNELNERVTASEKEKADQLEADKNKKLESAKSNKDIDAIERQHAEQMADLEKRVSERVKLETVKELSAESAKKEMKSIAAQIASELGVDKESIELLGDVLPSRITLNEQNQIIYLNADGSASTLDRAGFAEEVRNTPKYKKHIKALLPTQSNGIANGNNGGFNQAPNVVNTAAEEAKKKGDAIGTLNARLKERFK